jgi:hypothetical protein
VERSVGGRRERAISLHAGPIDQGIVPLLSLHHLEELLGVQDDATARARVAFLQDLPLLAWLRLPLDELPSRT